MSSNYVPFQLVSVLLIRRWFELAKDIVAVPCRCPGWMPQGCAFIERRQFAMPVPVMAESVDHQKRFQAAVDVIQNLPKSGGRLVYRDITYIYLIPVISYNRIGSV